MLTLKALTQKCSQLDNESSNQVSKVHHKILKKWLLHILHHERLLSGNTKHKKLATLVAKLDQNYAISSYIKP